MTVLVLDRLSLDVRSPRLDRHFERGLSVIVGENVDTLDRLHRVLAGVTAPRRGQVRWAHRDPLGTPELRARLGTLFPHEPPLDADGSVADFSSAVRARRAASNGVTSNGTAVSNGAASSNGTAAREHAPNDAFRFDSPLDVALEKRAASSLDARERRRVALRVALETPSPLGFVLHDPWTAVAPSERAALFDWLRAASATALVLLTTTDRRAAEHWSRETFDVSLASPPRAHVWSLLLRVERPREVASVVLRDSTVLRAEFDPRRPDELVLSGDDPTALRHAAQKAIVATRVDVTEMTLIALSPRSSGPRARSSSASIHRESDFARGARP